MKTNYSFGKISTPSILRENTVDIYLLTYAPHFSSYEDYVLKHYTKPCFRQDYRTSYKVNEIESELGKISTKSPIYFVQQKCVRAYFSPVTDNNNTLYH